MLDSISASVRWTSALWSRHPPADVYEDTEKYELSRLLQIVPLPPPPLPSRAGGPPKTKEQIRRIRIAMMIVAVICVALVVTLVAIKGRKSGQPAADATTGHLVAATSTTTSATTFASSHTDMTLTTMTSTVTISGTVMLTTQTSRVPATSAGAAATSSASAAAVVPPIIAPSSNNVFYGLAYQAYRFEACNSTTQDMVDRDMRIAAQYTRRLRVFGSPCGTSQHVSAAELVMSAIERLHLDIEVTLCALVARDGSFDGDSVMASVRGLRQSIDAHPSVPLFGIAVGNNVVSVNAGNAVDLQSALKQTKALFPDVRVGTAEAAIDLSTELIEQVDFLIFSGIDSQGTNPTKAFATINLAYQSWLQQLPSDGHILVMQEVGWATASTDGLAYHTLANAQTFLNSYICATNAAQQGYFYHSLFDEPKQLQPGNNDQQVFGLLGPNGEDKGLNLALLCNS